MILKDALSADLRWSSGKGKEIEKCFGDVLTMMNEHVIDEGILFDRYFI